jgi:hypothetical protein
MIAPVIVAVILGEHDALKHGAQLLAGHPQEHLCVG